MISIYHATAVGTTLAVRKCVRADVYEIENKFECFSWIRNTNDKGVAHLWTFTFTAAL